MSRISLALLLILPAVAADEKKIYADARLELERAYFDQLDAGRRDRLFEQYGRFDGREVVKPLAGIVSRFGTYMAGLEAQLTNHATAIRKYLSRGALSDQETGLRNSHQRKIDKLERALREAHASFDLLGRVVGSYDDPKTIQETLKVFGKHPTWRVRQLLAVACGGWGKFLREKRAFAALRKLARDDEAHVRVAAARAFGHFRDRPEALEELRKCLKDTDWRVRAAAVHSLGRIRTNAAITLLVETMRAEKGRLQDDINTVLKSITGKNLRYAESWAGWWKGVGEELPKREAAPQDTRGTPESKQQKPGHRFYGIPTNSDRICYIIDVSGSMRKEVEQWKRVTITGRKQGVDAVQGKTRIEVAKNELKRAIYNLNSKKRFTIIFFSNKVDVWEREMQRATPETKKKAIKATDEQTPAGATYTLGALREAFSVAGVINSPGTTKKEGAGVDTIFLLSDGGPTDNSMESPKPMDAEQILEQVRQWNKDAGIVIHTIAVHTTPAGTYFLKQLAAQNGGQFVERKNPTKKSGKSKKQ